jgi:hypothetical protein
MDRLILGLVVLALFIFAPWAFIWALNTLLGLHTPFTFTTWLAALVFGIYLNSGSAK